MNYKYYVFPKGFVVDKEYEELTVRIGESLSKYQDGDWVDFPEAELDKYDLQCFNELGIVMEINEDEVGVTKDVDEDRLSMQAESHFQKVKLKNSEPF